MVDHFFGDILQSQPDHMEEYKDLVLKWVMMAPTNTETQWLNEEILAALEGPAHVCNSVDLAEWLN